MKTLNEYIDEGFFGNIGSGISKEEQEAFDGFYLNMLYHRRNSKTTSSILWTIFDFFQKIPVNSGISFQVDGREIKILKHKNLYDSFEKRATFDVPTVSALREIGFEEKLYQYYDTDPALLGMSELDKVIDYIFFKLHKKENERVKIYRTIKYLA